jgi:hypothetical protein
MRIPFLFDIDEPLLPTTNTLFMKIIIKKIKADAAIA